MSYRELCERIAQMVRSASSEALRRFAYDSLRLLREAAHKSIPQELTDTERQLLQRLLDAIDTRSFAGTDTLLEALCDHTSEDEIRAIEIDRRIIDLIVGIDYVLTFERTGDPSAIIHLASTMVDSVDYFCSDVDGYSLDDMLVAPLMRDEYERQRHLLSSPAPAE